MRATGHHRDPGTGHARIDAVASPPSDDVLQAQLALATPQQAVVLGGLERHIDDWPFHLRRRRRQFSVAQAAAIGANHLTGFGAQGTGIGLPLSRGCSHQQMPCPCTDLPQIRPGFRYRSAATRALRPILPAHARGFRDLLDPQRQLDRANLGPIGIELFGNDHRQGGVHPLSNLGATRPDVGHAIGINLDEQTNRRLRFRLHRTRVCGGGPKQARRD